MSEHGWSGDVEGPGRVRTGVEAVDEVIESVEALGERPVEEHAGVFDSAHERLRRALDVHDQQS